MKLTIVSPTEKKEYDVLWVEANSTAGNFVLQPGHAPIVARLEPNKELTFSTTHGVVEIFKVTDGILKHQNNHTFVIVTA